VPLFSFEGKTPNIHPKAFIAETATIIGDVTVEEDASVWYGVVLRGDFGAIVIRRGANVQDNSVIHAQPDLPVEVGANATIAHSCTVHSATIGEQALIGNGTVVLDGANVGAGSLVAAGSTVGANAQIPEGVLAAGAPAEVKRPLSGEAANWVRDNPAGYIELGQRHAKGVRAVRRGEGGAVAL
jgi:carbonic anhydrase/acetyltransferase-like protein (isoleucine patch superfamily)